MSKYFPEPEQMGRHTIFPGVQARTAAGEKMMLSLVDMEANAVVEEHSHPHEQVGMMLAGRALFRIGDEERILGPGDMYRIPGGVKHMVIALDGPGQALDIFCPIREEYL